MAVVGAGTEAGTTGAGVATVVGTIGAGEAAGITGVTLVGDGITISETKALRTIEEDVDFTIIIESQVRIVELHLEVDLV